MIGHPRPGFSDLSEVPILRDAVLCEDSGGQRSRVNAGQVWRTVICTNSSLGKIFKNFFSDPEKRYGSLFQEKFS